MRGWFILIYRLVSKRFSFFWWRHNFERGKKIEAGELAGECLLLQLCSLLSDVMKIYGRSFRTFCSSSSSRRLTKRERSGFVHSTLTIELRTLFRYDSSLSRLHQLRGGATSSRSPAALPPHPLLFCLCLLRRVNFLFSFSFISILKKKKKKNKFKWRWWDRNSGWVVTFSFHVEWERGGQCHLLSSTLLLPPSSYD